VVYIMSWLLFFYIIGGMIMLTMFYLIRGERIFIAEQNALDRHEQEEDIKQRREQQEEDRKQLKKFCLFNARADVLIARIKYEYATEEQPEMYW